MTTAFAQIRGGRQSGAYNILRCAPEAVFRIEICYRTFGILSELSLPGKGEGLAVILCKISFFFKKKFNSLLPSFFSLSFILSLLLFHFLNLFTFYLVVLGMVQIGVPWNESVLSRVLRQLLPQKQSKTNRKRKRKELEHEKEQEQEEEEQEEEKFEEEEEEEEKQSEGSRERGSKM